MQPPLELLDAFAGLRVLVVGDAFLDGWLSGPSHRLSREAPVPIVSVTDTVLAPGGAANTAVNVVALGASVQFLSIVGDDRDGQLLRTALRERGVDDGDVLTEPGRRTVAKRRVVADGQMLTRFDDGDTGTVAPVTEAALLDRLVLRAASAEVVLVGDYAAGMCTESLLDALAADRPQLLVVDARELARWRRVGPTAVTPNWAEARALVPALDGADRSAAVVAQTDPLLAAAGSRLVVVTLDAQGAVAVEAGRPAHRLYTRRVGPGRTVGAGDSFAAAFALALAAGADGPAAAELAAAAASVGVRRSGTSVCSAAELRDVLDATQCTLLGLAELADRVRAHRTAGRRVVVTNGCFDLLHRGHVTYLNRAKALGDVLVVAVNDDASVARLKGAGRPVNPVEDRAAVLAGLSCVDHLVVFAEDTAEEVLSTVRPDVYVKGGDYTESMVPEAPLVRRLGGEVAILPYLENRSTTGLVERIRAGVS